MEKGNCVCGLVYSMELQRTEYKNHFNMEFRCKCTVCGAIQYIPFDRYEISDAVRAYYGIKKERT